MSLVIGVLFAGALARAIIEGLRYPWLVAIGANLVFVVAILIAAFFRARRSGLDRLFDFSSDDDESTH